MMTKKDYILIATVVHTVGGRDVRRAIALEFARVLTATNPRFDRGRFLTACDAGQKVIP